MTITAHLVGGLDDARLRDGVLDGGAAVGDLDERAGIEHERDATVGADARTAVRADPLEEAAERLDDDVLLVQDLVDLERDRPTCAAH